MTGTMTRRGGGWTGRGAAAGAAALLLAACAGGGVPGARAAQAARDDPPPPRFSAVSVHDPSVFPGDDGAWYVIGSHLASARTTDFVAWTQVTGDWNSRPNRYYPRDNPDPAVQTVASQIADVTRGAKNPLGFYAGDIHHMPGGGYWQYYCLTSSWYCSAIGLAVADAVDGPYVTRGLIVRSGEAADNSATPDGSTTWTVSRHPNCIDPQAFFDHTGAFYLVYGSWSGGVFILELDPETGLARTGAAINAENDGYGRRLIRNNHAAIEAPYIVYYPETGYYYLFVSFGGLAANGGYNIRVFRSRAAAGPYADAEHDDVGRALSPTRAQAYGVKIMGGYAFARSGGGPATGYRSPGHNSVWREPSTGRSLLIYHQRFTGKGEYHELRVAELWINDDGWPVASPFRYDGAPPLTFVTPPDLTGVWNIINHGRDNNAAPHESAPYELLANGEVRTAAARAAVGRRAIVGRWDLGDDGRTARITLDSVTYTGVFLRGFDGDSGRYTWAFTALSPDGVALWGAAVP